MTEPKRSLLEFVLVAVIGAAVAFAANAASSKGLRLARNYVPKPIDTRPAGTASSTTTPTTTATSTSPAPAQENEVERRLRADGINVSHDADTIAAFESPARKEGRIVFIDAREERQYAEGHIPGAYRLYQPELEKYKDEVYPVAMAATEKVIVYCNGGECDDSILTATELLNSGTVEKRLLYVYAGGITEWKKRSHPVEKGTRNSGEITEGGK